MKCDFLITEGEMSLKASYIKSLGSFSFMLNENLNRHVYSWIKMAIHNSDQLLTL